MKFGPAVVGHNNEGKEEAERGKAPANFLIVFD